MPRPKKERNFEHKFSELIYRPAGVPVEGLHQVDLHRDELEALRLCDCVGLTQEEAGQQMGVSRGTIQRILTVARSKTATALSKGYALAFVGDEM
ncbi:MAG: DUF134 domain-containing protein [Desulforhopalus sp.]|nr:DUF134 domain-containing protein [Desulforhopalus sp.]